MCIFSQETKVFGTTIHCEQLTATRHRLIYSNVVQTERTAHNCMILPIPANVNSINVIHGENYTQLIKDIQTVAQPGFGQPYSRFIVKDPPIRKEKVGMYDVSFCSMGSLNEMDISDELNDFFHQNYICEMNEVPLKYSFIFCEWEGKEPISSQPIVVEYDTFFPLFLYYPMMDGHGQIPVKCDVERNHALGMAAINADYGINTNYGFDFSAVQLNGNINNGDTFVKIERQLIKSAMEGDFSYTGFEPDPEYNFRLVNFNNNTFSN